MPAYLIGYDLSEPHQEYDELLEELRSFRGWWHHLDSTWIVLADQQASQIRDKLGDHIDSDDELAVFGLNGYWATKGIDRDGNEWLHDYL